MRIYPDRQKYETFLFAGRYEGLDIEWQGDSSYSGRLLLGLRGGNPLDSLPLPLPQLARPPDPSYVSVPAVFLS